MRSTAAAQEQTNNAITATRIKRNTITAILRPGEGGRGKRIEISVKSYPTGKYMEKQVYNRERVVMERRAHQILSVPSSPPRALLLKITYDIKIIYRHFQCRLSLSGGEKSDKSSSRLPAKCHTSTMIEYVKIRQNDSKRRQDG